MSPKKSGAEKEIDRVPEYNHKVLISNWYDRQPEYVLMETKYPWISAYSEGFQDPYQEISSKEKHAQDVMIESYNLRRTQYFYNKAREGHTMKLCFNFERPHDIKRHPPTILKTENPPNCFQEQKLYNLYNLGDTLEDKLKKRMVIQREEERVSGKPFEKTADYIQCIKAWKDKDEPFFEDPKFKEKLDAEILGDDKESLHVSEYDATFTWPQIKEHTPRKAFKRDISHEIDTACLPYKNWRTRNMALLYSPDYPTERLAKYLNRKPMDILPCIPIEQRLPK